MDSESMAFRCLGAQLFFPLLTTFAAFFQTFLNFLFVPLGFLGVETPNVTNALTGGLCTF